MTIAKSSIESNGKFNIAICGGSLHDILKLGLDPDYDYSKWFIFFVDERCVGLDDKDSNYNSFMIKIFPKIKIPKENIFEIHYSNNYDDIAKDYKNRIIKHFNSDNIEFDNILLSIGQDGHFSSLVYIIIYISFLDMILKDLMK